MRTFLAILLEEQAINRLYEGVKALQQYNKQGNFSRKENLHLTLVFIGETNRLNDIKQAMNSVHIDPFQLQMDCLGRFRRRGGDLYWAGVKHCDPIFSLYHQLCNALKQRGFQLENKDYLPHLTLGREVFLSSSFSSKDWESKFLPIDILVSKVSLMKSERINGTLTYTELYAKSLSR